VQPYFAAEPPYSRQLAARLMEKVDRWFELLPSLRPYRRARKVRQMYYGLPSEASPFDVTCVGEMGEQGELSALHVNHLHNLGQRVLTMTVQDDLGWQPVATNADTRSQEDAIIARSVLDYERRDKRLDRVLRTAAEAAFLDGSSWFCVRWDPKGGKLYERLPLPQGGSQDVYEGRLRVTNHAWWRCPVDIWRNDAQHDWVIITDFLNKHDLARLYPGHAQRLLNLRRDHRLILEAQEHDGLDGPLMQDSDLIPVYSLFHRATPAVPEGREVVFVDGETVLYDGASVYGPELPAYRMSPGDWLDTPHGATPLVDLVSLQQALNMCLSSVLTNNANGAVANIAISTGANLSRSSIDGANIWEFEGPTPPTPITMVGSDPETYKLAEILRGEMVQLAGLNPVSLGQQTQQMSGALAALLDSKAREAAAPFVSAYRRAVEDMGSAIVDRYQRFAKAPRQLEVIAGEGRKYMLQDFTGQRLSSIARVTVEARSSLLDTTAGRLDFIEKLMAHPLFQEDPNAIRNLLRVYRSGNLDPALLDEETEDTLVSRENDLLAQGVEPPILWDDPDDLHIQKHRRVAANPATRENEAVMLAYTTHMQKHVAQRAAKMRPPMPMGPGAPGEPPPPGAEEPMNPEEPVAGPVADAGPAGPGMPSMPVNPATGERAPPAPA
jgi:hypothetical protein